MSEVKESVRNTRIKQSDGELKVWYYKTKIVEVDRDGTITLDHGGWLTASTIRKMNQISDMFNLGYQVRRNAGELEVTYQGETQGTLENSISFQAVSYDA